MKRKRMLHIAAAMLLVLLMPSSVVLAADDDPPPDPGVGGDQDLILAQTVLWLLPYGSDLHIEDEFGDIYLDWEYIDVNSTEAPVEGVLALNTLCGTGGGIGGCFDEPEQVDANLMTFEELGLPEDTGPGGYHNDCEKPGNDCEKEENGVENGGTFTPSNSPTVVIIKAGKGQFIYVENSLACDPATMPYCVTWNGDGSITVVRNGSGPDRKEISNIQFWHTTYSPEPMPEPDNNCPDVFVEPGAISISGKQIAPNYAVVMGQDPDSNGVTLEWYISIAPTIVTYETWEVVDHRVVACIEGDDDDDDNDDDCAPGWHPVVEEVWGCSPKEIVYREEIDDLTAYTSLSLDSRSWIEGELGAYYPGAHLINPDWSTAAPTICSWIGDECVINFTGALEPTDPGWYDIKLVGDTTGTLATPPRSFNDVAGTFGVFMIDNTALTQ